MTKSIISIYFMVLVTSSLIAQNDPLEEINFAMLIQMKGNSDNDIIGSPYLEQKFMPGLIYVNGEKKQNAYFRYNVKDDQVELKVLPNQEESYLLPREQKYSYRLKNYTYELGDLNISGNGFEKGFVANYYESENIKFIGKPFVKIAKAEPAKTGYGEAKPASMSTSIKYYLSVKGEEFKEVSIKEKDFKNMLKNSSKIDAYLKDNKIKEVDDAVKFLKYYDSVE